MKGRKLSDAHRAALKCSDGCTCEKHTLQNSGQFKTGSAGFNRPHTEETKKKLAQYTGDRASSYKHGWANSPTYTTWTSMHGRCYDPRNASYVRYGAKGIIVCERWHDFVNFLNDMGERPPEMTLDRIDGVKGYEPSNCRWATRKEQATNRVNPWADPEKKAAILAKRAARRQGTED